jgi:CPA2 family monovalent cation:H+ antiporter-2
MAITPLVIHASDSIVNRLLKQNGSAVNRSSEKNESRDPVSDHLVIIGYGINGKNVARAARYANIPYIILELNAETVKQERANGEHIHYGDAVYMHALHLVHAEDARVIVVAISDPQASKTIVTNIRQLSSSVHIIVRTRFMTEIDELLMIGADEVIPEEFETSIEIFSRVLHNYLVPLDDIENLTKSIRNDNYQFLAPHHTRLYSRETGNLLNIECLRVITDHGPIVNHTIEEARIRNQYQVNILAIARDNKVISNIKPGEKILRRDLVYVSGEPKNIEQFNKAINS